MNAGRNDRWVRVWVIFVAVVSATQYGCDSTLAEPPEQAQTTIPAERELFFDATSGGEYVLFPGESGCKALVLIFFGYDCPISNAYSPELDRLHKKYSAQGIEFCVVYADADLTKDDARKHSKEYGFGFPAILDPEMSLALRVGAKIKPEAAILSPRGDLLYRGRIDDLYADFGKRRASPAKRELRDALDSILADKPIAVRRTEALGCDIDLPPAKK